MKAHRPATTCRRQGGFTLVGLVAWAVGISMLLLLTLRVAPTVNEYLTIKKAIDRLAHSSATTVPELRAAFDKFKDVEYAITSIGSKDLVITKQNDRVVVSFAYDKEIELFGPVYLLIKYRGSTS